MTISNGEFKNFEIQKIFVFRLITDFISHSFSSRAKLVRIQYFVQHMLHVLGDLEFVKLGETFKYFLVLIENNFCRKILALITLLFADLTSAR